MYKDKSEQPPVEKYYLTDIEVSSKFHQHVIAH